MPSITASLAASYRESRAGLRRFVSLLSIGSFVLCLGASTGDALLGATPPGHDQQGEFFEKRIRPVLSEQCYECHNSQKTREGSLAVDSREGLLTGGDQGPAVVPGKPAESTLVWAIRHEHDIKMPKSGGKLSDRVVADFVTWIKAGAHDPRDKPPTAEELAQSTSWETISRGRRQWWSFQPVVKSPVPKVLDGSWSPQPVDRFILARLEAEGLRPNPAADRRTLIRRVSYLLTGLPPTAAEIAAFEQDRSASVYHELVDRLLASPRFGERWARHWMDWVRYAETHGSEGDPSIPYAWRYRDYLIRALNADVPYDQMLREHIAGDLLPQPRLDAESRLSESALGTAHYRMVLHGYAPTDALDEQALFTDNQIDVISKAFLGLTVSCARCHNHKFDAISQRDFYALYGIMASCRPAVVTVDTPQRLEINKPELAKLKARFKPLLAEAWLKGLDELPAQLRALPDASPPKAREARRRKLVKGETVEEVSPAQAAVDEAAGSDGVSPLSAWLELRREQPNQLAKKWQRLVDRQKGREDERAQFEATKFAERWKFTGDGLEGWFPDGPGIGQRPSSAGEFHILPEGPRVVSNVYAAGLFTHGLSSKHRGVLTSPRFKIETDEIRVRVAGGQDARIRFAIQNYPRVAGPTYFAVAPNREEFGWYVWNMKYWKGESAYLEIATGEDLPVEAKSSEGRSWFGLAEVICRNDDQPKPVETGAPLTAFVSADAPGSTSEVLSRYQQALGEAIEAWRDDKATDAQASLLGFFVRYDLLPNTCEQLSPLAELIAEYRRLEAEIPLPTRSPGVLETAGFDQPLFVRGNHRQPGEIVPRSFLEAFGAQPYRTPLSGRLELAQEMSSPKQPLVARVIVNRLWHHLFGEGLVATVDNFGHLGAEPTHPELLDYLAASFVEEGWSMKNMIRTLVLSETFRTASQPSPAAHQRDPANRLRSHFQVRRLEAEAIRDTLLQASGRLEPAMYGPSVPGHAPRRSVYVAVLRNNLDPLLGAFDAPVPFAPQGRRDLTNVPAQSLALLNDPFVIGQAQRWAERLLQQSPQATSDERLRELFSTGLGREPSTDELAASTAYLAELATSYKVSKVSAPREMRVWRDMAHTIMNLKEFIYLH
jgi:hypothetical protein